MTPPGNSAEARALPVIQADREAAADTMRLRLEAANGRGAATPWIDAAVADMLAGDNDVEPEVQAFAKHRLTFSAEQNTGRMPGREELACAIFNAAPDRFMRLGQCYPIADAIRRLSLAATGGTGAEAMREAAAMVLENAPSVSVLGGTWRQDLAAAIRALPTTPGEQS